ncbi:MAG: hypothetical protein K2V38_19590, partial [Gemmataceae bacterium]|nr:hypothetical protein [Gemmataceae bacterium]
RVPGLDGGATLDASGLEATQVNVGAKIDGQSTLKVNAPNGVVHFAAKVDGKSVVEVNAPGGEVKFVQPTTATKDGSKIDGGSTVAVTGRTLDFKGDITGEGTKVNITLTRNAWLKVASVSGKAVVEYKPQQAGWSPPDVNVGAVAQTATFRPAGGAGPRDGFDPNGPDPFPPGFPGEFANPPVFNPNPPRPPIIRPRPPISKQ